MARMLRLACLVLMTSVLVPTTVAAAPIITFSVKNVNTDFVTSTSDLGEAEAWIGADHVLVVFGSVDYDGDDSGGVLRLNGGQIYCGKPCFDVTVELTLSLTLPDPGPGYTSVAWARVDGQRLWPEVATSTLNGQPMSNDPNYFSGETDPFSPSPIDVVEGVFRYTFVGRPSLDPNLSESHVFLNFAVGLDFVPETTVPEPTTGLLALAALGVVAARVRSGRRWKT